MGDTPRCDRAFQGRGNKILTRQLIESFWTAPGGGYFIGHIPQYTRKSRLKKVPGRMERNMAKICSI
jgi:hypothetical protein